MANWIEGKKIGTQISDSVGFSRALASDCQIRARFVTQSARGSKIWGFGNPKRAKRKIPKRTVILL